MHLCLESVFSVSSAVWSLDLHRHRKSDFGNPMTESIVALVLSHLFILIGVVPSSCGGWLRGNPSHNLSINNPASVHQMMFCLGFGYVFVRLRGKSER